jgi:hypothetical protein
MPSAKRVLKEYCVLFNTPDWVLLVPFPSFPDPFQFAVAKRFMSDNLIGY